MTSTPQVRHDLPVSQARLWYGFTAAPIAWAVAGLAGYAIVGRSCSWHGLSLAALVVPHAPAVAGTLSILALLVIVSGMMISLDSWRRVTQEAGRDIGVGEPADWGRARFMAFGGLLMSALFLLGTVFIGLPTVLVDPCNVIR